MNQHRTINFVLLKLMQQHDLNDNELARLSGVPQPTITRIRNGTTKDPESGTVEALARYFNIPSSELRGEDNIYMQPYRVRRCARSRKNEGI